MLRPVLRRPAPVSPAAPKLHQLVLQALERGLRDPAFYDQIVQLVRVIPTVISLQGNFFSKHFDEGVKWYRSCFPAPAHKDGKPVWTREASPNYLFYPHAARRTAEVVPDARLIVLLRNPVDRAYSHYHHQVRIGHESLPGFEEALEAEEERLRGKRERMLADESYLPVEFPRFSYVGRGLYANQLEEWHRYFDKDQLLAIKSEDFFERTEETLAKVVRFVGLPKWEPERTSRRARKYTLEPMNPDTRERLEEYFKSHNQRLYEYLGVDFGW